MLALSYIDLFSRKPVSEQVIETLANLITTGGIREGDKLPSVRDLAGTFMVSPNTIMKAFRELESRGMIASSTGLGTYVAPRERWIDNVAKNNPLLDDIRNAATKLAAQGVSLETVVAKVREGFALGSGETNTR